MFAALPKTTSLPNLVPVISITAPLPMSKLLNKLTDSKIRSLKATGKAEKHFDGGSLYLYLSPTGSKTWRIAYRLSGRPQTMSVGPYPEVSLSEARVKRDELKATLRDGGDPMAPRKINRSGMTLREASTAYWSGRSDLSPSYLTNATRGIEMHLCKGLGDRPVGSITRDDLLAELVALDAKGRHVYVRKVRMWAAQVFEWAVEHGYASINPAALIRPEKAFGKAKVVSFAALELRDVPAFMQRLALEAELQSVLACRMLAYTWVRTNELRMMTLDEINDDEQVWVIPAGKMKRPRDHVVPLPRQAMEIVRVMKQRNRKSKYLFPHETRDDRPMSENSVLYLIGRIGYKGVMTGHGWRSVASTWANERGYNEDAIEMQLAHVPNNKIRAVYNRSKYLDVRREMLQAHADWIDSCAGSGVR